MAGPAELSRARPATILDVAAAAGVSRQTVTRAMNAMPGISAETRDRVLATAQQLDYRPSRFGRGLVTGGHRTLGLVIHDLTNPYYPEFASAVSGYAAAAGWHVLLVDTVHAADLRQLLTDLAHQVDAVVGYLGMKAADLPQVFAGLPVVEIDPSGRRPTRGAVQLDPRPAMAEAVDHLVERGVRRAAMIDASAEGRPTDRAKAFVEQARRVGLPTELVHVTNDSFDAGADGMNALLARVPSVDGVLAFNDMLAFGALEALRAQGRRVPEDVKVIGIDGLSIGALVTPPLTSLAIDLTAVGLDAIELVVGMATGELPRSGVAVRRRRSHRLLVRAST